MPRQFRLCSRKRTEEKYWSRAWYSRTWCQQPEFNQNSCCLGSCKDLGAESSQGSVQNPTPQLKLSTTFSQCLYFSSSDFPCPPGASANLEKKRMDPMQPLSCFPHYLLERQTSSSQGLVTEIHCFQWFTPDLQSGAAVQELLCFPSALRQPPKAPIHQGAAHRIFSGTPHAFEFWCICIEKPKDVFCDYEKQKKKKRYC